MSWSSIPHSVKRWQLHGTDYEPQRSQTNQSHSTVFSAWTPLNHKKNNLQNLTLLTPSLLNDSNGLALFIYTTLIGLISDGDESAYRRAVFRRSSNNLELKTHKTVEMILFEKRIGLVLHWFDLWTDTQRKHLLHSLLSKCTKSQLKFCRDLLIETLPVTRVDFTTVLPRFLSLYVLSFLSPQDLCSAAQVSWSWRILSEQDCLWASRCIGKGWFLPYTPAEKEYGAWKKHYVSCVSTLDWLTPREAQQLYGTLNERRGGATEEEEERRKERRIRDIIRERLQHEKREVLRTRRPWGSSSKLLHSGSVPLRMSLTSQGLGSSELWPVSETHPSVLCPSLEEGRSSRRDYSMERSGTYSSIRSLSRSALSDVVSSNPQTAPPLLLLVSDRLSAYEMVLSGAKAGVVTILYDHRHTLSALLTQVERALSGQRALRLGVLAPGGTEGVQMLQRSELSEQTLLAPDYRDFWEKMCLWISPTEKGGGIDIFCPLGASASGVSLMQSLSALTGVEVRAPMGLSTGSFQNILGEWCDSSLSPRVSGPPLHRPPSPALQYLHAPVLQAWCTQALWAELCLSELRTLAGKELQWLSAHTRGRALGHYFQDKIFPKALHMSTALDTALTEALTAATAQEQTKQLEFVASFLTKHVGEKTTPADGTEAEMMSEDPLVTLTAEPDLPLAELDWRGSVVRELYQSENLYLSRLTAVQKVYEEPLTAALNSNRAIISIADIQIILSPVSHILQLNRVLQTDLDSRLRQWSAQQCVGDVLVKFCQKLRIYTNYFNNYCTAVHTIDKCRESKPLFRAFLKRTDRTLTTHMLSLQELLLCPLWRIEEYCTLTQALSLHTAPGHADHAHLSSALSTLRQYKHFLQELKRNSQRDKLLEEAQQMIQGCPKLAEGNRQLVTTHRCALYRSLEEQLPDSVKALEQVAHLSLFLFTDALVLTRLSLDHVPFGLAHTCTYSFMTSVALSRLSVREINHSRYVSHAYVLEGPCRSWVCAADSAQERALFLSVLQDTIESALRGDR
ncbi:epithelial cell-transforming sequence 2 oncogene-like [Periophthalmus magnuspinnatus]|uniref:epithelial cell-transforming sequence 2 oncogene-like n=1 Tax=Periophthalmus magnuspinnatus TaxID=409849 RepID=UPI0024370CFC|nr:epithelial cell-transforming sequence 2 oncogene-like [Periophthalmus magnuspinnatus]